MIWSEMAGVIEMLLSEEELERLHKRFPYPRFSPAEYQRRYQNIRQMMRQMKLDCLLIIGGSAAYGRLWFNFRYVTNMMGKAEMANYCFFPKEGDPCLILRPGHSLAGAMLARTVVREIIVGDPSVLTAIVRTIQERGCDKGRVGIVEYDPYTSIPKITGISLKPNCATLNLSSSPRNSLRCGSSRARKKSTRWKNPPSWETPALKR
jgi:hypothetical protein